MTDHFRVWLDRHTATVYMERAVARAVHESQTAPTPQRPDNHRPKMTPGEMRGIPIAARGVGGAIPGSRPDSWIDR